ncbi:unnamed protein product [Callosobruchus maculatus]|uniref:CBM21 domain-containing protein n=1 Tax=Callosobruchus maculatus TaxID=64391 RepID=A0A653C0J3_CALMS|nr:unnamed protein product [Callosobruchus maculatus]
MTSNGEKCGLSSLLPMSCRSRAEALARSLHTRLKNIGAQNNNNTDESSWLAAHENAIATSQPRHMLDFCLLEPTGTYLDPLRLPGRFKGLEFRGNYTKTGSPEDPEAELEEEEINRLINGDGLLDSGNDDCHRSASKNLKCSSDSDSDVFYDIENDLEQENRQENGNSEGCNEFESECSKEDDLQNEINLEVSKSQLEEQQTKRQLNGTKEAITECNGTTQDINGVGGEEGGGGGGETESGQGTNGITDEVTQRLNDTSPQEEFASLTTDISDEVSSLSLRDEDCISDNVAITNENACDIEAKQTEEALVSNLYVDKSEMTVECTEVVTHQLSSLEICVNGGPVKEEDKDSSEEDDERIPHVRRCSSLKTGKTPPGTPGRKKIVRFADALGLDLADVRTFLDEIPKVPTSAYEDLSVDLTDSPSDTSLDSRSTCPKPDKVLMPLFQQPGGLPNFLDLVRDNNVCLENAVVDDPFMLTIKGFVRVRNLDFHKSVYVRYTLNSWKTYADVQATYVENSCDGFSDKFSFVIYAHSLSVGQRIELACRFQCKGCQYWDNNNGRNYCLQCLPVINHISTSPITTGLDWGTTASFYY